MDTQTRDPLMRLPYETWLQCFSLAIHDSAHGPLPYLAISPNWNETILNSPLLWSQIIMENGDDDEAQLRTFLHLSASQLLDVECVRDIPVQLLQLLAQHRTRIRSLVIGSTTYTTIPGIPTPLWGSLGNPKMRRLAFRDWQKSYPIPHELIPACPNLRSLEVDSFIDESMIVATLEEASLSIGTLADLDFLCKCAHLRSITLTRLDFESIPEPEVRNHFLQLSNHLGPRLVNLDITLSLKEFIVFLPYIPSFTALYSAIFDVSMSAEEPPSRIATPIPKQGTLNLRMLSLQLDGYQDIYKSSSTCHDTVGHILDYLCEHQILQDLHTFQCDLNQGHVDPVRIGLLLRCLSKVRVLNLMFEEIEADKAPPTHMPNLLELSVKPISWLAHIEAPNLVRLDFSSCSIEDKSVTPHLSDHFGSKISHLVVEKIMARAFNEAYSNGVGPKFESLRTLLIADSVITEWVVHLPSIRTIDFKFSETLHFLLVDLLRNPGALPNLSTIKLRDYPCWELLFEVLRRRNALQMHQIQELVFPRFPILAILSRLVKLLQGHTDVYTNRDIDEVIQKRRMDESFAYICEDCLFSGYIRCFEPISLDDPSPSPDPFLDIDSPVDLLTLESIRHADGNRKFRGWGDWETLMKEPLHSAILSGERDYGLGMGCSRSEKGDATISKYTLSGKSSFH